MKRVHFYYFCLYNFFYKDGWSLQEKLNYHAFPVEQRPVLLLGLSTWLWTVVIRLVIKGLFYPIELTLFTGYVELLFALTICTIYHFYFVDNNRYMDFYAEYRLTDKKAQRRTIRKLFLFLGLPVLLIPLLAYWSIR